MCKEKAEHLIECCLTWHGVINETKKQKPWNRFARIIEMKSIHTSWANIAAYFVISTLLPFTYQTNRLLWFIESRLTKNGFGWNNLVWKREEKHFAAISCWYVCYHLFHIFLTALLFFRKRGKLRYFLWQNQFVYSNLFLSQKSEFDINLMEFIKTLRDFHLVSSNSYNKFKSCQVVWKK